MRDRSLSKLQAGRLVQRLLEINTYRLLALLALPLARELAPRIHALDVAVGKITAELADSPRGDEKRLLDDLSERASDLEKVGALTSYRFAATRAYFDIVQARLPRDPAAAHPGAPDLLRVPGAAAGAGRQLLLLDGGAD